MQVTNANAVVSDFYAQSLGGVTVKISSAKRVFNWVGKSTSGEVLNSVVSAEVYNFKCVSDTGICVDGSVNIKDFTFKTGVAKGIRCGSGSIIINGKGESEGTGGSYTAELNDCKLVDDLIIENLSSSGSPLIVNGLGNSALSVFRNIKATSNGSFVSIRAISSELNFDDCKFNNKLNNDAVVFSSSSHNCNFESCSFEVADATKFGLDGTISGFITNCFFKGMTTEMDTGITQLQTLSANTAGNIKRG